MNEIATSKYIQIIGVAAIKKSISISLAKPKLTDFLFIRPKIRYSVGFIFHKNTKFTAQMAAL